MESQAGNLTLPVGYNYKFEEPNLRKTEKCSETDVKYAVVLEAAVVTVKEITDREKFEVFLKELQTVSKVEWRVYRTRPYNENSRVNELRKLFRCQHKGFYSKGIRASKNTDCPAMLDVTVKKNKLNVDDFWPCILRFVNVHNHPIPLTMLYKPNSCISSSCSNLVPLADSDTSMALMGYTNTEELVAGNVSHEVTLDCNGEPATPGQMSVESAVEEGNKCIKNICFHLKKALYNEPHNMHMALQKLSQQCKTTSSSRLITALYSTLALSSSSVCPRSKPSKLTKTRNRAEASVQQAKVVRSSSKETCKRKMTDEQNKSQLHESDHSYMGIDYSPPEKTNNSFSEVINSLSPEEKSEDSESYTAVIHLVQYQSDL